MVATTPQAAELVRAVLGDRGHVTGILAANSDPHDYEPRPSDAAALAGADLIVRSGGEVDGWLDQLVSSSGSDAPVLVLADHVDLLPGPDGPDPHWWQDPRNAQLAVAAIARELDHLDPASGEEFDSGAHRYAARLGVLDRRIAACLRAVPAADRELVTSHDSLAYFARRYDIDVIGAAIPALSTAAQPSAGQTAELIELIEDRGVHAVFPEVGASAALERAIAGETGARVGAELWTDTLGPPGSPASTYTGSLAANARALVAGLGGGHVKCRLGG
ncbi:MAG TPA: metal ABC transporter substrate-binding protein [Solirubrobacterales bacterium]|nr:metal ABC transporter substrate-binding protein [Solirubrobacterales bacterium]